MPGVKTTALTKATTLNNTDVIYVVKPGESVGSRSQGIEKSDFESSFSPGGSTVNRVVQGGIVWTGTGLVYESLNLIYEINGQQFAITDGTQITLATADGTHPRLDNLYGDDTGAIGKITGTPAASPVLTSVDETSQISITFALVAQSATEPSDVDIRDVYLENAQEVGGEWDTAESTSGVRIDLANTSSPLTSTKDIKTLSALSNGDTITFNHTTATTIANFNYLQLSVKLLALWANDHLIIQLKNGATVISTCIVDGAKLDITDVTSTQTISLFKAEFTAASDTEFDTITIYNRVKGASTLQYQMDDITVYEDSSSTEPVQILASDVSVNTDNFATNLSSADDTVQKALDTLDDLVVGGGGGAVAQKTGTTIVFTEDAFYNEASYLTSGNLTLSLTSAVVGVKTIVYCDRYIPTISGTEYLITGFMSTSKLNQLEMLWDGTDVQITVVPKEYILTPSSTVVTPSKYQNAITSYQTINVDTYSILFNVVGSTSPYATNAAMFADQGSQVTGSLYVTTDSGNYNEYLGTTVGDITDYTIVSSTETGSAAAPTLETATGTITCASAIATDTVTVNGLLYTAVAGAKADNTEFSIDTSDTATATDLADSITNDVRSGTLNDVTATSNVGVVTCTQTVSGASGNATTLVSSTGVRLAVSDSIFTGGNDVYDGTSTSYTHEGLTNGTTYYYFINGTGAGYLTGDYHTVASTSGDNIDTTSLVGWYKLDEIAGTTVTDSHTTGNNGTNNGADLGATGVQGNAYTFVSANTDDLDLTALDAKFNATDFTAMCWMKTTGSLFRLLQNRSTGAAGSKKGWAMATTGTNWGNTLIDDGAGNSVSFASTSLTQNDGDWHHMALTWDSSAGTAKLYSDGSLKQTVTDAALIGVDLTSTTNTLFGSSGTNQYFNGDADILVVYQRLLELSEIQEHYNSGVGLDL